MTNEIHNEKNQVVMGRPGQLPCVIVYFSTVSGQNLLIHHTCGKIFLLKHNLSLTMSAIINTTTKKSWEEQRAIIKCPFT